MSKAHPPFPVAGTSSSPHPKPSPPNFVMGTSHYPNPKPIPPSPVGPPLPFPTTYQQPAEWGSQWP